MIEDTLVKLKVNADIEIVTVETSEEAIRYRHIGGPTIQVNGLDIEPNARTIEQFGIS